MASPMQAQSPSDIRSPQAAKPQRVLACLLCQQRKTKCDRMFPCANCVRAGVQCVPVAPRQRRRRFPERELLGRLRHYEDLLRQNNIQFDPLHASTPEISNREAEETKPGGGAHPDAKLEENRPETGKATAGSETAYEAKNFWHLLHQMSLQPRNEDEHERDDDQDSDNSTVSCRDLPETVFTKTWDQIYDSSSHDLLFGSRMRNLDLSTLHPEQVQIFRLWQIYLDNINPLLKVTHTPTLQVRIINAASNVANIQPPLEALMFSIYCVSIQSLSEDECVEVFGSTKQMFLKTYQFGCQQALLNSGVLRANDLDCLTALYLYLVSVKPDTDPQSLSSMLGVAIRTAQRMGIHNEPTYLKCTAFEGEMRRRLWWSLVMYDNRISEISDQKITVLGPTWDCKPPLNVNDFDIRPEMESPPPTYEGSTEALFAVVRSELGDFIRHSPFHLDYTNPSLKAIARNVGDLATLEKTMEDKYLKYCNSENPLHYMATWMTRSYLAKNRLLEHYLKYSNAQETEAEREAAISYALTMIECDTKLNTSPRTKGYLWFVRLHFPFPAYLHLTQELRKRPMEDYAKNAWKVMDEHYEARFGERLLGDAISVFLSKLILQTWEAREAMLRKLGNSVEPPRVVSDIRAQIALSASIEQSVNRPSNTAEARMTEFSMPMHANAFEEEYIYGAVGQGAAGVVPEGYSSMYDPTAMDTGDVQPDWIMRDWFMRHA